MQEVLCMCMHKARFSAVLYLVSCLTILLVLSGCYVKESTEPVPLLSLSEHDLCHDRQKLITFIRLKEIEYSIPSGILQAMIFVESSYMHFTLNIGGVPHRFRTKNATLKAARSAAWWGKQLDIGLCQINYNAHKENFDSILDMMDPFQNIDYSAKLLALLYSKKKNWKLAIQSYHGSRNQENNRKYLNRVLRYREKINSLN